MVLACHSSKVDPQAAYPPQSISISYGLTEYRALEQITWKHSNHSRESAYVLLENLVAGEGPWVLLESSSHRGPKTDQIEDPRARFPALTSPQLSSSSFC